MENSESTELNMRMKVKMRWTERVMVKIMTDERGVVDHLVTV